MNKKGFTLTEMMIVVIIITGLMFLIVPNITESKKGVDEKTCEAYISLVDSQIQAYYLKEGSYPTLELLVQGNYIKSTTCPDGTGIIIENGKAVKSVHPTETTTAS